jgi:hypothetical protein
LEIHTHTSSQAKTVIKVPGEFLVPGVFDFSPSTPADSRISPAAHNVQPHLFH